MQFEREKSGFERQALVFNALVVLIIKEVASIRHGVTGLNVFGEQKAEEAAHLPSDSKRGIRLAWVEYLFWQQHIFEGWMNLQMKYASGTEFKQKRERERESSRWKTYPEFFQKEKNGYQAPWDVTVQIEILQAINSLILVCS